MFEQVKMNLFTIPGLIVTLIHLFVVVGFVTCWVAFQTQVLGNKPLAATQQSAGSTRGARQ